MNKIDNIAMQRQRIHTAVHQDGHQARLMNGNGLQNSAAKETSKKVGGQFAPMLPNIKVASQYPSTSQNKPLPIRQLRVQVRAPAGNVKNNNPASNSLPSINKGTVKELLNVEQHIRNEIKGASKANNSGAIEKILEDACKKGIEPARVMERRRGKEPTPLATAVMQKYNFSAFELEVSKLLEKSGGCHLDGSLNRAATYDGKTLIDLAIHQHDIKKLNLLLRNDATPPNPDFYPGMPPKLKEQLNAAHEIINFMKTSVPLGADAFSVALNDIKNGGETGQKFIDAAETIFGSDNIQKHIAKLQVEMEWCDRLLATLKRLIDHGCVDVGFSRKGKSGKPFLEGAFFNPKGNATTRRALLEACDKNHLLSQCKNGKSFLENVFSRYSTDPYIMAILAVKCDSPETLNSELSNGKGFLQTVLFEQAISKEIKKEFIRNYLLVTKENESGADVLLGSYSPGKSNPTAAKNRIGIRRLYNEVKKELNNAILTAPLEFDIERPGTSQPENTIARTFIRLVNKLISKENVPAARILVEIEKVTDGNAERGTRLLKDIVAALDATGLKRLAGKISEDVNISDSDKNAFLSAFKENGKKWESYVTLPSKSEL